MAMCRDFLAAEIEAMKNLRVILCLGKISHDSVVRTLGGRLSAYPFGHGAEHDFGSLRVLDSYHCSRYNTQTKRLSAEGFRTVMERARAILDTDSSYQKRAATL